MKKGLSIAEMLAVIVVMGIIAAIAIPLVGKTIEKSRKNAFIADIHTVQTSAQTLCTIKKTEDGCLNNKLSLLTNNELSPYLSKSFEEYREASVHYLRGYMVDLKDDLYETRDVVYDSSTKTFTYTQGEILPNEFIDSYVIKNKS